MDINVDMIKMQSKKEKLIDMKNAENECRIHRQIMKQKTPKNKNKTKYKIIQFFRVHQ